MRAVELFGGGGGAWQGLTAAGVEVVRSIEWDEAAHAVAEAAGCPSVCGDVRRLNRRDKAARLWESMGRRHRVPEGLRDLAGTIDLMWSSTPCQDFSSAGRRLGASGDRNGFPWMFDSIDMVRPTWVMIENVSGLLMHSGAHCGNVQRCPACYFHGVILPELRARFAWVGYSLSDAADWGTPQHRRRVCIIAGPERVQWPKTTHAAPHECLGLFATRKPWTTVREALGLDSYVMSAGVTGEGRPTAPTAPTATLGSKGTAYVVGMRRGREGGARWEETPDTEPSPAIRTPGGGSSVPSIRRVDLEREDPSRGWERQDLDAPSPSVRAARPGGGMQVRCIGGGRNPTAPPDDPKHPPCVPDKPSPSIRSGGAGHSAPPMWLKAGHPELLDRPSACVSATEVKGTNGKESTGWTAGGGPSRASDTLWLATGRRRLSVSECRILMGWDERYDAILAEQTKTAAYRILGNGVVPKWAEVHVREVVRVYRLARSA